MLTLLHLSGRTCAIGQMLSNPTSRILLGATILNKSATGLAVLLMERTPNIPSIDVEPQITEVQPQWLDVEQVRNDCMEARPSPICEVDRSLQQHLFDFARLCPFGGA